MLRSIWMRVLHGAIAALALLLAPAIAGAEGDLVQTVATQKPRAEISQFLVRAAEKAAKARDWAHAIPLYQALVVARGNGSDEAEQLATLWTLAGQNEDAAAAWSAYAEAAADKIKKQHA